MERLREEWAAQKGEMERRQAELAVRRCKAKVLDPGLKAPPGFQSLIVKMITNT